LTLAGKRIRVRDPWHSVPPPGLGKRRFEEKSRESYHSVKLGLVRSLGADRRAPDPGGSSGLAV